MTTETVDSALLAPGSDAARTAGCVCPVLDNAHGKGYMGGAKDENGEAIFVTRVDCSLHGQRYGLKVGPEPVK